MTRICVCAAGVVLLSGLSAGSAVASSGAIEEIVVTAQKRESTLQDTPIAISAVTADAIEERQVDSVRQIQYLAPNLVFNSLGGTTNLYMRGVGTDINDSLAEPGVALYIDGVYQGVTGDQSAIYNDLERIEVLRGPQGTLYGRNSTGGNVHVFTRQPGFEPGLQTSLLLGEHDRVKVSVAGQGTLVEDRLAARVSVVSDRRDGVRDNLFNGRDIDRLDLKSGAVSLLFTPSEQVEFTLRGDWTERKDDSPRWAYIEVVPDSGLTPFMFGATDTVRGRVTNNTPSDIRTKMWGISGTLSWDFDVFTLKSITAYRESDWGGPHEMDGTDISWFNAHPDQRSEQWSQEIDFSGTAFDDRLDWIVGLYYFKQDSKGEYHYELPALQGLFESLIPNLQTGVAPLPAGGLADPALNPLFHDRVDGSGASTVPFFDFLTYQDTESRAVFAQGTYRLTDRARVTLGARYTADEKDVTQTWISNFLGGGCVDWKQNEEWKETTWKVGADYDVSDDVMAYVTVSRGFHAGGFNGGSCANEYDPETVIAYEAGIKTVFADRRAQLNLAAFHYDYEDYQARLFIEGSAFVRNATEASIQGLEAEFLVRPIDGLEIDGSVAWLDGEFDKFSADNPMTPDAALVDLKGNQLLRSPEFSYNLGIQYTAELGAFGSLTARYEAAYKDDYSVTIFNDDFAEIEAYTLQNVRLIWSDGRNWEVQAFVENLTDEKYLDALVPLPNMGGTVGMWALPRLWGMQIRYGLGAF